MIISKNMFFTNVLPKTLIIKIRNYGIFIINILLKKKRVRLKFKQKKKKKTILMNFCPLVSNLFLNFNKSVQCGVGVYSYNLKKIIFLIKYKIK
jgi:hypothetical protein